ncbi:MAG: ABC transporter permease [Planctomycetes bacterium]|nr:ABC transporter permease [Planctomycetota bacterium]
MYHALLCNRYLTSRVIPLIAVAAVALCVALVIMVVSVMTGFLDMVRSSGRTLMGDVIITYSSGGIPYYERLIDRLETFPDVSAATAVVDSWGLLRMPYPQGPNKETEFVQVWGIEPEGFAKVTGYAGTLYWRSHTPDELNDMRPDDPRRVLNEPRPGDDATTARLLEADGLSLRHGPTDRPGIALGIHVSAGNERQPDGSIRPMADNHWWMPRHEVTLTVVPSAPQGGLLEPQSRIFPVVNEFSSGVFLIDDKRVMIPLSVAQDMLHFDEGEYVDDTRFDSETGLPSVIGVHPARATMVLVRAVDGVTPDELLDTVNVAYGAFYNEIFNDVDALLGAPLRELGLKIKTWEQQQAQFIGPIEKERELMRTLFSLVYLVCAGLVLAIFWAIVYEKTRDIGILRSIGASRLGIAWIFLRYGLVVGVAGAILGAGLAWLVVHNINAIHDALDDPPAVLAWVAGALALAALVVTVLSGRSGKLLPIVLGTLITVTLAGITTVVMLVRHAGGIVIWDPTVYYFNEIPNTMDVNTAIVTMIGAVVFSLIGAFLPAAKAADTDPVKALRYE